MSHHVGRVPCESSRGTRAMSLGKGVRKEEEQRRGVFTRRALALGAGPARAVRLPRQPAVPAAIRGRRALPHAGRGEPAFRPAAAAAARPGAGPRGPRHRRQQAELARPAGRRADPGCRRDDRDLLPHRPAAGPREGTDRARGAPPPPLRPRHGARIPRLGGDGADRGQRPRPARHPDRCRHHPAVSGNRAPLRTSWVTSPRRPSATWMATRCWSCPASGSAGPGSSASTSCRCAAAPGRCSWKSMPSAG